MLTRKQLDLLKFIDKRTAQSGISPSFDEMKEALNLKSKSGIHRLIMALEERGFIRRLPHRARALEVIKKVRQNSPDTNKFKQNITHLVSAIDKEATEGIREIPLLGRIAAGEPIEAMSDIANHIGIPNSMASHGNHFALEVKGESMVEAGINHGDIVVIKEQNQANNGDIVVALIRDHEATLKRLHKKGPLIELEAANHYFGTQVYEASEVTIQGKLIGLLRTY